MTLKLIVTFVLGAVVGAVAAVTIASFPRIDKLDSQRFQRVYSTEPHGTRGETRRARPLDQRKRGDPPLRWTDIESTNYLTFSERLRRIGCPEQTIRELVVSEINALYRTKRKELLAAQKGDAFWQADYSGGRANHLDIKIAGELDAEKAQLIRQILGDNGSAADLGASDTVAGFAVGFLGNSRRQQTAGILAEWRQNEQRLLMETQGLRTEEDNAAIVALRGDLRNSLAGVLTTQELHEFDLRNSDLSTVLRARLKAFSPTEAEFRAVFDIAQQAAGGYVSSARGLEDEASLQQIKETLGPQRFEQYLWAQDPAYSGLIDVVERFNLDQSVANQIYRIKLNSEASAATMLAQSGSNPNQALPQLENLAHDATQRVQAILGDKALKAYADHGGLWLQNLALGLITTHAPGVTLHVTP